jgi:cardiolipin synthase
VNSRNITIGLFGLPNILTLTRLAMTIPIVLVLLYTINSRVGTIMALFLIGIGGAIDKADGVIARKYNMETDFGKLLDPVVDKVWIHSIGITLLHLGLLPFFYVVMTVARDLIITNLRESSTSSADFLKAAKLGKLKFRFQVFTVIACLMHQFFLQSEYQFAAKYLYYCILGIALYYTVASLFFYLKRYLTA